MTRGNQRELARAKNAKKQQDNKRGQASSQKDGNKGMTLEARKQRDAEMMRLKQQKATTKKDGGSASAN
ncbi:modifier of protein aggregation 4 [Palaemon carinicauda]|uniref:modifier of protein aggregation 4 n=1 Tax=Palaemon carinicauda TaxID=392227 RepID=UPI0035B579F8